MTFPKIGGTVVCSLTFASIALVTTSSAQARALTIDERIAAQKAIEQVYWNHRVWPKENPGLKPPSSAVTPDTAIRAKVEDYLQKSNALEKWWHRPVSGEQLQAELDRMATHSQDGATLRELFEALGNDPYLIAETLGRQTLVDRLIREWYANDSRFHSETQSKAERAVAACTSLECMKAMGGEYRETTWKLRSGDADPASATRGTVLLDQDEWTERLEHVAGHLEETADGLIVTQVRSRKDGVLVTGSVVWPKKTFDAWWSAEKIGTKTEIASDARAYALLEPSTDPCQIDTWAKTVDEPIGRYLHTAVWTGAEMIVWGGANGAGGNYNSGGRYNPSTDSWTPTSQGANVPAARNGQSALWTGSVMIIWSGNSGGPSNSGGRYNPSTDTWMSTSQGANVPTARLGQTAVWTGSTMIVWGGSGGTYFNTGGRYDPTTDTWLPTSTGVNCPSPRNAQRTVWTGSQMIIFGGQSGGPVFYDGGRYDPVTDTWSTMTPALPTLQQIPAGSPVWSGTEMIMLGGRYKPATDSWQPTSSVNNPTSAGSSVWTGTEMILWGGTGSSGARYNPTTNTWVATSTGSNVPSARNGHTAVWTGSEMIVWGGQVGNSGPYLSTGGRYNPSTDSWVPTHVKPNVPAIRDRQGAVWTGTEMIIWGGTQDNSTFLTSGGRYNPATDSWVPTSQGANTPSARNGLTAVWTGTEMIIWGGQTGVVATGGLYNPATDTWRPTSTATPVPSPRVGYTAVWTGTEMIIWGGGAGGPVTESGGRYSPVTDSWTVTSLGANVPLGRSGHSAVWTGSEMIVWGGIRAGITLNTGGRYNPSTDSWLPTSTGANVPAARSAATAVWTGNEMIVWGGDSLGLLASGGRYNPSTDSWIPTSVGASVPSARYLHTSIWTGREMIVWGGSTNSGIAQTGGRYDPSSNSWLATSVGQNVPVASYSHTAVWTGNQMIVWGGNAYSNVPGVYCACPSGLLVYRDADGDGYGSGALSSASCDGSIPSGYVANNSDCDDSNAAVHPGATETCNAIDDNCDGIVDNGGASALCNDADVCTTDICGGAGGCSHVFNSAPCDDGQLCTNNDTCSTGTCSGTVGPPPDINTVTAVGHAPTTLSWSGLGGGTVYDLTTQTLSDLRVNYAAGATCLANDVSGTSYPDPQANPSPGDGYYYLIRAQNVCGTGSYGFDSTNVERVPTAGCP